MNKFTPRDKLSKKSRKALDNERRKLWSFSPATRKVESKKLYSRKRRTHDRYDDYGMGSSMSEKLIENPAGIVPAGKNPLGFILRS